MFSLVVVTLATPDQECGCCWNGGRLKYTPCVLASSCMPLKFTSHDRKLLEVNMWNNDIASVLSATSFKHFYISRLWCTRHRCVWSAHASRTHCVLAQTATVHPVCIIPPAYLWHSCQVWCTSCIIRFLVFCLQELKMLTSLQQQQQINRLCMKNSLCNPCFGLVIVVRTYPEFNCDLIPQTMCPVWAAVFGTEPFISVAVKITLLIFWTLS